MEHQRTPKQKIPKWNMSIFQNKKSRHGHWLFPCLYVLLLQRWRLKWWWKWFRLRQYAQTWRIFKFWNHTWCNFGSKHLINACLSSEMSLQYQADSYSHDAAPQCLNSNNIKSDHGTEDTIKTFPTMLKLISGTLVGGVK